MGRVLVLTLRMLRGLAAERTLREGAERERAEREQAEAAYRRLVERLPAIVYRAEVGEVGAWTYVSPQIESILGFSPEEWCADPTLWEQRLHPEDRERAIADEHAAARGQRTSAAPTTACWRATAGWSGSPTTRCSSSDEHGRQHWHGVLYDISDRKRAEAELELRAAQQAAVARLGQSALEGQELAGLMHEAVATAAAILDIECAHVLELRPAPRASSRAPRWDGRRTDAATRPMPNSRRLAGRLHDRARRAHDRARLVGGAAVRAAARAARTRSAQRDGR